MEALIKAVTEAGLGLGSLLLMGFLLYRRDLRQDEKDKAYIEALAAIRDNVVRLENESKINWEITRSISEVAKTTSAVVSDSAKALSTLSCLQKR